MMLVRRCVASPQNRSALLCTPEEPQAPKLTTIAAMAKVGLVDTGKSVPRRCPMPLAAAQWLACPTLPHPISKVGVTCRGAAPPPSINERNTCCAAHRRSS